MGFDIVDESVGHVDVTRSVNNILVNVGQVVHGLRRQNQMPHEAAPPAGPLRLRITARKSSKLCSPPQAMAWSRWAFRA